MLLWLLGAIAASYVAAANEATQDEVRSWIQSEWERAASLPDLKGFEFRFRIEHREVLPEQKLAELRALVAGRPDHPERKTIERSERRKSRGPDVLDHRLWLLSSGEWRLNTDQPPQHRSAERSLVRFSSLAARRLGAFPTPADPARLGCSSAGWVRSGG